MHFDDGTVTIVGDPLLITHGTNLISVLPDHVATINVSLQNPPGITDAFHKYKMGTVIVGGTNSYSGDTTIEGGTLQLGGDNRLPSTTRLIFGNGGTDGFTDTPPTFATGGFNQTLGSLALTGPNPSLARTIDLEMVTARCSLRIPARRIGRRISRRSRILHWARTGCVLAWTTTDYRRRNWGQIQFVDYANAPAVIDNAGYVLPNLPKFLSVRLVGSPPQIELQWSAANQRTYQLESRNDFSSDWTYVGEYATSGSVITVNDSPTSTARFYRVTLLP